MSTPAKPTGKPRNWTREAIALLLLVDDADLDGARQLWTAHAPSGYAGILDNAGFTWDGQTQTYTARHGRRVDGHMMKRIGVTVAASVGLGMQTDAMSMAQGMDIGQWQDEQAKELKHLYLAMMGLAAGGVDSITTEDELRLASTEPPGLGMSLEALNNFAAQAARGEMTEAEIVARAGLYAPTANSVYEDERRASHGRMGVRILERNILGPADHCEECPALTELGWIEFGSLPLPGQRQCLMHCHCSIDYARA